MGGKMVYPSGFAIMRYVTKGEKTTFLLFHAVCLIGAFFIYFHNRTYIDNTMEYCLMLLLVSLLLPLSLFLYYIREMKPLPKELYEDWVARGLIVPMKERDRTFSKVRPANPRQFRHIEVMTVLMLIAIVAVATFVSAWIVR